MINGSARAVVGGYRRTECLGGDVLASSVIIRNRVSYSLLALKLLGLAAGGPCKDVSLGLRLVQACDKITATVALFRFVISDIHVHGVRTVVLMIFSPNQRRDV